MLRLLVAIFTSVILTLFAGCKEVHDYQNSDVIFVKDEIDIDNVKDENLYTILNEDNVHRFVFITNSNDCITNANSINAMIKKLTDLNIHNISTSVMLLGNNYYKTYRLSKILDLPTVIVPVVNRYDVDKLSKYGDNVEFSQIIYIYKSPNILRFKIKRGRANNNEYFDEIIQSSVFNNSIH